ncbi:hypothetical protein Tco_0623969 [Tanacetum coccineum]|uniref:Uncharacterized protein n=1 Tax=Tanacetum coccineum TaxID=301880 RepID=A0ABQ4WCQ7_9ASTR
MTYTLTELRPDQNGLQGSFIFFKLYTPKASLVEYGGIFGVYLKKLSLARTLREKDREARPGSQSSTKEVSLKNRVMALDGLCDSLMILPKEIKSLKARVYKLETIINHKDSTSSQKDKLRSVDALDALVDENGVVEAHKDLSQDDCVKAQKIEAVKNRVAKQRRIMLQLRLEEENSMKSIDFSKSTHMKLALEKCGTNKRRCEDLNMWEEHIELWVWYMWHFRQSCHDWSMVSCYFLTLLLQDSMSLFYATDEIYPLAWRDAEQFHIQSGNVTFYDSQKIYDVEYRLWYVKMRSCLEFKLPVVLQRTGVFASKGIDPTSYSIKFSHAQNVPKQDGLGKKTALLVVSCLMLAVSFL